MSHFVVLVIGDNPETQLQPFQENNMDDCPKKYLEFNDMTDECESGWKNETSMRVKLPSGELIYRHNDNLRADVYSILGLQEPKNLLERITDKQITDAGFVIVEASMDQIFDSYDEYVRDYCGYEVDEKMGVYGYWENPNSKWDWYKLGGRWTGYFKVNQAMINSSSPALIADDKVMERIKTLHALSIQGVGGEATNAARNLGVLLYRYQLVVAENGSIIPADITSALQVGEPGLMTEIAKDGFVDSAPKYMIDFGGMKKTAITKAIDEYEIFSKVVDGISPPDTTWNDFREQQLADKKTIDDIRTQWHNHPWNIALTKADIMPWDDAVSYYCVFTGGKDKFIAEASGASYAPYAVLMDGEWHERGEMGWFGMSSNDKPVDDWNHEVDRLIDLLPDTTIISAYDCHI